MTNSTHQFTYPYTIAMDPSLYEFNFLIYQDKAFNAIYKTTIRYTLL